MASAAELIPNSFFVQAIPAVLKCVEKSCPFPPVPGETFCRRHLEMFAASDDELLEETVEESSLRPHLQGSQRRNGKSIQHQEVRAEVFAGRVEIENPIGRWRLKKEETKENGRYKGILSTLRMARMHRRRREAGLCPYCKTTISNRKYATCDACREKGREKIKRLKESGLCSQCHKQPAAEGHVYCASCRTRQRTYGKRHYRKITAHRPARVRAPKDAHGYYLSAARSKAAWRTAGRCLSCGRPRDNSTTRCQICREKKNAGMLRITRQRKKMGICANCGTQKARPGRVSCGDCGKLISKSATKTILRLRKSRLKVGLCPACGSPRDRKGLKTCSNCSIKFSRYKATWRARKSPGGHFSRIPETVNAQRI